MLTFKPWKVESVLQMFLGVFGGMLLFGLLTLLLGYRPVPGRVDHTMLLVAAVSFPCAAVPWLHWLLKDHEMTWVSALGLNSRRLWVALPLGFLVGVIGFFACNQLAALLQPLLTRFEMPVEAQPTIRALQSTVSPLWTIAFAVLSIGLAPVVEEFIFRGLLFPILKQLGLPIAAWLGSSLFFAVIHGNVQAFVPLTVLALMLTWLYDRTDNLMAPILAHATFNAINFALTLKLGAFSSAGAAP